MPNLTTQDIDAKLTRCFQAVLSGLTPQAARAASAETTEGWDSTMLVTLMAVVEEEFAISVNDEDLEHWTSYANVKDYIEKHI